MGMSIYWPLNMKHFFKSYVSNNWDKYKDPFDNVVDSERVLELGLK